MTAPQRRLRRQDPIMYVRDGRGVLKGATVDGPQQRATVIPPNSHLRVEPNPTPCHGLTRMQEVPYIRRPRECSDGLKIRGEDASRSLESNRGILAWSSRTPSPPSRTCACIYVSVVTGGKYSHPRTAFRTDWSSLLRTDFLHLPSTKVCKEPGMTWVRRRYIRCSGFKGAEDSSPSCLLTLSPLADTIPA